MAKKRSKKELGSDLKKFQPLDNTDGLVHHEDGEIEYEEDVPLDILGWGKQDVPLAEWLKLVTESAEAHAEGYDADPPVIDQGVEESVTVKIRDATNPKRKIPFSFRPSAPTQAAPGSPEKLAILRARKARKPPLPLFHPDDFTTRKSCEQVLRRLSDDGE